MAQIRSKQIADFLQTVDFANLTDATKIASGLAVKNYISDQIAAVNGDTTNLVASVDSLEVALSAEISATNADFLVVNGSIDSLEVALSAEIDATNSDVTRIDANVSTEKARIDAILLASDADKDSFAEIVSVINAVDLTNDNAVAQVILDLNAEISATNADVTSINTRATNIETLNTAQNASIDELELALSYEITRATDAETDLQNDIAFLSTEVVNEVASIDERLGEVSGDLVDSVDSLEAALTAEIEATNSDFTSVERKISEANLVIQMNNDRAVSIEGNLSDSVDSLELALTAEISATNADFLVVNGSIDSLEVALSAEISATDADFISVNTRATNIEGSVATEKGRIDAILLASDANKDSFAEIVSLINQVDTTNDDAFAAYALANNASVDSLEVALSAEISATNADITSIDTRLGAVGSSLVDSVDSLELALSAEISATNSDFVRVEAAFSTEILNVGTYVNGEVDSLESTISDLELAHGDRLTSLEGYIMEDVQMYVESFVGNGLVYSVANAVQDWNKNLVTVFVNGHKVEVAEASAPIEAIILADPGYVIDGDDTVVITYQG